MEKLQTNPNQILRKKEILGLLKISDPTLWRMEKAGRFPKRLRLGGNSCGWLAVEVEGWIAEKVKARGMAEHSQVTE